MENRLDGSHTLSVNNFRSEINKLFIPHKQKIQAASNHFKQKYLQYKSSHPFKRSVQYDAPLPIDHQRSPSYLSELSWEPEVVGPAQNEKQRGECTTSNKYELREWQACEGQGFNDSESIQMFYNELFSLKKIRRRNDKSSYDFKKDEKELLVRLFNELKGKDNYVTFDSVIGFFSQCKLYYLCYNIQPHQLIGVLKDSAHQKHDRLTLNEFLNIFFADRPNIIRYGSEETGEIKPRCVLSDQSWKELKAIFETLDTFGNETIYMGPFLYKLKNNYSNPTLIHEPALEFPEIGRTITLKKVIFNIEYRHKIKEKIKWEDIQAIFHNYEHRDYPTIDRIYQEIVETGQISKFTNAFMLKPEIIQEIKRIYYRSPKYCDFFVKSKFICKELLDSLLIKKHLREAIVRIVEEGRHSRYILLEEQIRILASDSEEFIDLDQLLEYFSIKGLQHTAPQAENNQNESSDEENQLRIHQLQKAKSLQQLRDLQKDNHREYKPVRHLTLCQEFSLSKRKGQTIMERKTRQMKEEKELAIEKQLKKKFKANPIPAELNPERYRAHLKKMEEQKQLRRQQIQKRRQAQNRVYQYLKTNTLLFTTKNKEKPMMVNHSYHYAAKPIPWHLADTDMLDKINEKKKLRRKKMTTDAKIKILKEWKDLPDVAREFSQPSEDILEELQSSLQPKQPKSKVKEVPNFAQLHKEFAESLQKKKNEWIATKPIEFKFSTHKVRQKVEENNRAATQLLKRVKSAEEFKKSESPHHKTSVQTYIVKEKVNIPTTIKHEQMCNFNQERMQNQLKEKERQRREQINRKEKQRNFAKLMRKKLQQNLKKSQSLHDLTNSKTKKHRQDWKKLQKQSVEDLCRIYFSVMNRPFLFESSSKFGKLPESSIPLLNKNKNKNKRGGQKQDSSKHIHQSPLKAYDPQNFDSKQSFRFEAVPCLDEEGQNQYLNQSF